MRIGAAIIVAVFAMAWAGQAFAQAPPPPPPPPFMGPEDLNGDTKVLDDDLLLFMAYWRMWKIQGAAYEDVQVADFLEPEGIDYLDAMDMIEAYLRYQNSQVVPGQVGQAGAAKGFVPELLASRLGRGG